MPSETKDGDFAAFDGKRFASWEECLHHERCRQIVMLGFPPELAALIVEYRGLMDGAHRKILSILRWPGSKQPPILRKPRGKQ